MMSPRIHTGNAALSRRELLAGAGLFGVGAVLSGCRGFGGDDAGSSDGVTLNMAWWGDTRRAASTRATLDVFQQKNPGIKVATSYQDASPYKDKLATRFAAGDAPDLMAMRVDALREYADRGSLLELNAHRDVVDISTVDEGVLGLAAVGDKNYGIASGLNAIGFVVNQTLTDKYKVEIPDGDTWGWEDLAAFAQELTTKSKKKVFGTYFEGATLANLIVFTRQRGEDFFTEDGKIGLTEDTAVAWLEMIEKMRAQGGYPPTGFIDPLIGSSPDQSYLAKGTVASQVIPTNNLGNYNAAAGGNLKLLRIPGETQATRRGQSIDTPMLWSISQKSKHPTEALKLLNHLINDVDGAKAVGTTRGVPVNTEVAAAIKPTLTPDDQVATNYIAGLQKETLPQSYSYPQGSSTIYADFLKIATEVEFKRETAAAGGKAFVAAAQKALVG